MHEHFRGSSCNSSRRRVLGLIGTGLLIPLAGCIGDDDSGDLPLLRDVLQWESNYVIWHAHEDHIITVHGDDFVRSTWDADDLQTDHIRTGNEVYLITDPHWEHDLYDCVRWTDVTDAGLVNWSQLSDQHGDVRADEQTSLLAPYENDPVYRFELDDADIDLNELFVAVETGYPLALRSTETDEGIGFHSWGHEYTIPELPTDCRSP